MDTADMQGHYNGRGTWRDSAGNSGDYDVVQINRVTERGVCIRQKHAHRDGDVWEIDIVLERVAPFVYSVTGPGESGGYGFFMNDVLRFHFHTHLKSVTEVAYQAKGMDRIVVYGSTTKNSAGNYIMWHEELVRIAD